MLKKNLLLKNFRRVLFFGLVMLTLFNNSLIAGKKAFTVEDAMKFKSIKTPVISDDGRWVAWSTQPDRGDPEAFVRLSEEFENDKTYNIPCGTKPLFTNDAQWLGVTVITKEIDELKAEKDKKPKNSLTLLNLTNGEKTNFENVSKYQFSEDSKWVVYVTAKDNKKSDNKNFKISGNDIVLRHLQTGSELPIQDVTEFIFDSLANYFVYVVSEPNGKRNGLYYIKLQGLFNFPQKIAKASKAHYSTLKWSDEKGMLAFISAKEDSEGEADSCSLMLWDSKQKSLKTLIDLKDTTAKRPADGWIIPFKNELNWTKDGERLFFGLKPANDTAEKEVKAKYNDSNFYNIDTILKETELDVWHWNDPRIKSNQKIWWKSNKDNVFLSVFQIDAGSWTQLADTSLPNILFTENPNVTIGYNDIPYLKEITWSGNFKDLYAVELNTGKRRLVVEKLTEDAILSPNGNYIAYFKDKDWFSYNCKTDSTANLTKSIVKIPFYDIDYDQPSDAPSYGFAGWIEGDKALLIYDKYDIWKFFSSEEGYINMTAADGRINNIRYRILNLDPDKKYFSNRDDIIVSGFNDITKTQGVSRISLNILGPERIKYEENKISVIAKAKSKLKFLFFKQKYDMFPDVWVSDSTFSFQLQVSDVHPELKDYNFGKTELVSWVNSKGDSLRGWVIKPETMEQGKKYPMLVYFYDKMSDLYNSFFTPKMNHRPCYPIYTGKNYVIFHPDIKYQPGNPGFDATDCILTGVRNILKQDYVDSNAIGIQGHSWGGYQTAFIITQTNLFKAASAGAPVGNMTSAYSGLRYGTGLARQFQYEKEQSRIGGTLWDSLSNYIRNSMVFNADKIKTPFLIMFGDEDPAVPWQQGIEIYLTMRRLNKQCVFLEYRGEPHWPEKYPDRLDYAIKMMEFYDHYLLGKPAPDWLTKGIEYRGK
jgi:dipeptidyl aminopeptidase/acylaminoacyl peptidase